MEFRGTPLFQDPGSSSEIQVTNAQHHPVHKADFHMQSRFLPEMVKK